MKIKETKTYYYAFYKDPQNLARAVNWSRNELFKFDSMCEPKLTFCSLHFE